VVTALPQPDRQTGGWDFVLKDISPQREAQEAYRRLVEQSLQGLFILQDDAVAYANRAYAAMTGYHVNELYEMDPDEYFAQIHPKDRDTVRSRFRRKLAQQPTPEQFAYRVYRKDESLRWFEVHVSRTTFRRRPALQAMVLDVTERKAAEERLAYLA
jgi:PAS domain S-box-containing protein